ncbi:uncharacterized protein ARMOST_18807 [Armillaria ostoyae]|uniref:Uncharacterized protein n=1 Tax=Armillaria ostoyae TaxID=47428 RepID=A0A284S2V1_ARMOS|nr:uncharacterized protein ARMOST_18807 [Armillaria ostoyae]
MPKQSTVKTPARSNPRGVEYQRHQVNTSLEHYFKALHPNIPAFNHLKCPSCASGDCRGIVKINLGAAKFVCDPDNPGFSNLGRVIQLCVTHNKFAYLTDPLSHDELHSPAIQTVFACRRSLKPNKRTPRQPSSSSTSRAAIAPSVNDDDWYMPVQSSPCPAPSSSKVSSHRQPSTGSSPRVPQPFPDIPPLDEPDWPRQKTDHGKKSISTSSTAQPTQSSNIGEEVKVAALVEIICWLEDGELPHHAIMPESVAGEVILQCGHVVLGQAGIEKVGSFARYDPTLHDWVPCLWGEPTPMNGHPVLALRRNGVFNLAGWSDFVREITA